jgi:hypothetical protein
VKKEVIASMLADGGVMKELEQIPIPIPVLNTFRASISESTSSIRLAAL